MRKHVYEIFNFYDYNYRGIVEILPAGGVSSTANITQEFDSLTYHDHTNLNLRKNFNFNRLFEWVLIAVEIHHFRVSNILRYFVRY